MYICSFASWQTLLSWLKRYSRQNWAQINTEINNLPNQSLLKTSCMRNYSFSWWPERGDIRLPNAVVCDSKDGRTFLQSPAPIKQHCREEPASLRSMFATEFRTVQTTRMKACGVLVLLGSNIQLATRTSSNAMMDTVSPTTISATTK